ncbi:MAG: hypothetical protein HYZ38_14565 [Mycobacterium sp.]|nr:hypothetical protein [Mycobacterium sp.]
MRLIAGSLVAATAVAAFALAPTAAADPSTVPTPGSEPAAATIEDLSKQGYNVDLNWLNGSYGVPLNQCSVTAIQTPDRHTANVDVSCPPAA